MTIENQNISMYIGETKDLIFVVEDEDVGGYKDITGFNIEWKLVNRNTGEVLITKTTASGIALTSPSNGIYTVSVLPSDTATLEPANWYYHLSIGTDPSTNVGVLSTGNVELKNIQTSNLGYLIPHLRLFIGDINPSSYRYMDDWLLVSLQVAIKTLALWWRQKYLIDDSGDVYRNTNYYFSEAEPPIILQEDERPIIVMASIIILEGSLENSAWNIYSWKDAEVSFSNLESGRIRDKRIERLWDELTYLLSPPSKRLANPLKGSLPGYLNNAYEVGKLE